MSVAAPPRFGLRIPASWYEFDVWRAVRTGDLTRMVDARIAEFPELRPRRTVLLKALRKLAEEAERRGAVYCAATADELDGGGHLLASLMVFATEGMPLPELNTAEAIAAQITTVARGEDPDADWREVRLVDLDVGRAVRVRSVTTQTSTDGSRRLPLVGMQTLIPVPGTDRILDIALTSPQVGLAEDLFDLFDAVSGTLTWEDAPPLR